MSILVITVIGTDRAGLVSALAGVVADHEGNWTRSQLAELAGAFAGFAACFLVAAVSGEMKKLICYGANMRIAVGAADVVLI